MVLTEWEKSYLKKIDEKAKELNISAPELCVLLKNDILALAPRENKKEIISSSFQLFFLE
jgi:hypothetical protein